MRLFVAAFLLLLAAGSTAHAQLSTQCPLFARVQTGNSYTVNTTDQCYWVVFSSPGQINVSIPTPSQNIVQGLNVTLIPLTNQTFLSLTVTPDPQTGNLGTVNNLTTQTLSAGTSVGLRIGAGTNWYGLLSGGSGGSGSGGAITINGVTIPAGGSGTLTFGNFEYRPLNPVNNLSDLTNSTSALNNLGLGTTNTPSFSNVTLNSLPNSALLGTGSSGVIQRVTPGSNCNLTAGVFNCSFLLTGPYSGSSLAVGAVPMGAGTSPVVPSEISDVGLLGVIVGSPAGGAQGAGTINASGVFINGVGVGTGSGSVTNVSTTAPLSGGPITTTGTLSLTGPSNLTNFVAGTLPMGAGSSSFAASEITDIASGGVRIGAPLGGQEGAGTLNIAGDYWTNGSRLTTSGLILPAALPKATALAVGAVQGDGNTLSIAGSGVISCVTATSSQIGCLRPDGSSILISSGVISAPGSGGGVVNVGVANQVAFYPASSNAVSGENTITTAQTAIATRASMTMVTKRFFGGI